MGPRLMAVATVAIITLGNLAIGLLVNSFDVSKAAYARIALAAATILAGFATLWISADREKQRKSSFSAELDNLVASAGASSRSEVALKARSHLAAPSPHLEQQVDRALSGAIFPSWPLARAIIKACIVIAAANYIALPADAADLAAWEARHRQALRPSLAARRSWVIWTMICAVAALVLSAVVPMDGWFGRAADPRSSGKPPRELLRSLFDRTAMH